MDSDYLVGWIVRREFDTPASITFDKVEGSGNEPDRYALMVEFQLSGCLEEETYQFRNGHKITLTFAADKLAALRQESDLNVKVISCPFLREKIIEVFADEGLVFPQVLVDVIEDGAITGYSVSKVNIDKFSTWLPRIKERCNSITKLSKSANCAVKFEVSDLEVV